MMRMRTKLTGLSPMNGNSNTANGDRHREVSNGDNRGVGGGGREAEGEGGPENWEMRPCGMLVQKRVDGDQEPKPIPTIRVRVKYASIQHEIHINSHASFGELKKMLAGPTGLHHQDMKIFYKQKERDSKEFLDIVGVKDKSKMSLVEDPLSQEKRYLEMRKNAKLEKAAKSISEISLEVDRLAGQVAALESVILKGGRVAEKEVANLIELLMNELIKLDGIYADGDVKLQRKMQVTRVQKYVETLDMLKIKNSTPATNGTHVPSENKQKISNGQVKSVRSKGYGQEKSSNSGKPPLPQQRQRNSIGHSPLQPQAHKEQQSKNSTSGTVVTTQWETFENAPPLIPISTTSSGSATPKVVNPNFPWDFE